MSITTDSSLTPYGPEVRVLLPCPGPVLRVHAEHRLDVNKSVVSATGPIDAVAAPAVAGRVFGDLCPYRVVMAVLEECQKIPFAVAQDGLVAALEQMTNGFVLAVKVQSIALVDTLEGLGQGYVLHLDQQMEMIAHEDIGIETEMMTWLIGGHNPEVLLVVGRIFEDLLLLVAAGDDVIEGACVFYAGLSRHGQ